MEETASSWNSLAELKTRLPNAYFEYTAELPLDWGYASRHAFNVGNCPLYDQDRAWFGNARGYVDWFEVGVNGNVTRYNVVPEPGCLALVGLGLAVFAWKRSRNQGV